MPFEKQPKLQYCETVGDLIGALQSLPADLPVRQGFSCGVQPIVYNITTEAFLEFAEADGGASVSTARLGGDERSWIDDVVREVAELPDRSSPEDWPEAMLVMADELRRVLEQSEQLRSIAQDAARYRWMCDTATGDQIDLWACHLPEQQDAYADKGIARTTTPNCEVTGA